MKRAARDGGAPGGTRMQNRATRESPTNVGNQNVDARIRKMRTSFVKFENLRNFLTLQTDFFKFFGGYIQFPGFFHYSGPVIKFFRRFQNSSMIPARSSKFRNFPGFSRIYCMIPSRSTKFHTFYRFSEILYDSGPMIQISHFFLNPSMIPAQS